MDITDLKIQELCVTTIPLSEAIIDYVVFAGLLSCIL